MNKSARYTIIKEAGFLACLLFLCSTVHDCVAQQWSFDEKTQRAYDLALNLQTTEALAAVAEPRTAQEYYVRAFAESLELLITEDLEKFSEYEDHFQDLIGKKIKSSTQDYQFLMAEAHLQWAFVYLKFGHELDAASNLREAYQVANECRGKSANYLAIQKTTGLLEVIIGSVPEKYNWVLSLLGMEGSIARGLADLERVRQSNSAVAFEADLVYGLIHGFVFQKPDAGFAELKKILAEKPGNKLAVYVAATLAIKNSQSEEALTLLNSLTEQTTGLPLYYADYLRGEIYLHKANYLNAISAYRWFINHYKGQNYLKDAHYKIGLCYWLNGNVNDALALFKEARSIGQEASEADKAAAASLAQKEPPHVLLSKVRYAMDGGYYPEARTLLNSISEQDLPYKQHRAEFQYRWARLEHKTAQPEAAKQFYKRTIELAGDENWYFAPNSCLQIGYILLEEKNPAEAKKYFQKALTYKRHQYKNSIDSKARSALSQLR